MEIVKGTYILDLTKSEEELMASFDKGRRWAIKKGEREHIPVSIYDNVHIIYLQDKNYNPSSILGFKIEDNKAILVVTNNDSALKHLQGNSLAYWETIKYAKKLGATFMDLGGVDMYPTESQKHINAFKKDFGGELVTYTRKVSIVDWFKSKFKRFVKK